MSFDPRQRTVSWPLVIVGSLLVHGALAGGMALVERPVVEPKARIVPVKIRMKVPEPPPPPKEKVVEPPKPPEPEPVREAIVQEKPPEKAPPKLEKPKAKKRKPPKKPQPKPTRPQETKKPPPPDAPPPPPLMGLNLQGATKAAPGAGIAVPDGAADGERYGAYGGTGDRKNKVNNAVQGAPPSGEDDVDRTVPSAGVNTMPVLVRDAKPKYPAELKREGIEGRVVLSIVVGSDGKVRKAKVVKSLHPELNRAAIKAARRLRFRPAKANGKDVAVRIPYTFTFVIE